MSESGGMMVDDATLTSLVLTLEATAPATLPRHVGGASHAAFLSLVAEADPDLAAALHDSDQQRPFTCSTLLGGRPHGDAQTLSPDQALTLRFTGLNRAVSALLVRWAADPPPRLRLLEADLAVTGATVDPALHRWAGATTYEALAAARLLPGASPARGVTFDFAAPTAFRSGGRVVPLPQPELVFGSLVMKWNAFANVALADEVRRFAEECMGVSRFRIETQAIRSRGGSLQIGFTGRCRFTAFSRDRYWLGVVQVLADFARYAGVGYQTTMGMGQVRRVDRGA